MQKIFLILAAVIAASNGEIKKLCENVTKTIPTDVIMLVDRSDSIAAEDFKILQATLSNFLRGGLEQTEGFRVSLITFARDVAMEFSFDDDVTFSQAATAVSNIDRGDSNSSRDGSFTFTYDALQMAADVLVPQTRPSANLFVLLFTDGESNGMEGDMEYTIEQAAYLKSKRAMKLISVGVGPEVNEEELVQVSSDGIEGSTVFIVSGFKKLRTLVDQVIIRDTICSNVVITTTTSTTTTTTTTTTAAPTTPATHTTCRDGTLVTEITIIGSSHADRSIMNHIQSTLRASITSPAIRVNLLDSSLDAKNYLMGLNTTDDDYPIAEKIVITVIDKAVSEMQDFLSIFPELSDFATKIIPMDVTGDNGQYELRQLAREGRYEGRRCLFCGGLREYYLRKCANEISDHLQC